MGFATIAMRWVSVAEAALLVYTMPIWAMLLAWPLSGAKPTAHDIAALLLGVIGIWILLGGRGLAFTREETVGIILALASAVSFALGTIVNRPIPVAPIVLAAWQVGLGCLAMVVIGLAFERPNLGAISSTGTSVMIYMTVVPMGICYLTWFEALRRLSPSTASTAMLMVPLIGVISAAMMIGEPVGARELLAMFVTLGGVLLAMRKS
jgi:drug/metabolite transporter (DMT)-like permease